MFKNTLFPVDLHEESSWQKALPMAVEYCRAFNSTLHVLNVVPSLAMGAATFLPEDAEQKMMEHANNTLAAFVKEHVPETIEVHRVIGQGSVYQSILEVAERIGADIIVLASHRPALSAYLLGPNAARVVRHAKCSVLVVR